MSENLEIKIDLKLDDEKAQAQMTQALSSLKDFANNKANNINIKVNVDDTGLKNLEKIESAVKEINKLSKEAQKSLFSSKKTDNTASDSIKEQKKLYEQRMKQEKMYAKMFENLEVKDRNKAYKEQQRLESQRIKDKAKQEEQAVKTQIKNQTDMYSQMFKDIEKQEKEATAYKQKQEQMYSKMFESIAKQEAEQIAKSQKERAKSFDSIEKDMQKAQSKIGKLEKSGFVDMDELDKVKSALREISDIHVWDNIDNLDLSRSRGEIDKILESLKQIDDVRLEGLKDAKIDNFTTKMTGDLDKLESKFKEIGKSTEGIERLRAELQSLDSVAPDKLPTTFQRMRQEVSQLNDELRQSTKEASGMGNFLEDISDSMRTFTLGNMIGDGIVSSIIGVTQSFMEMDSAITNVKKVAEATDVNSALKLDGIKSQAIDIAKEVGMASSDVINGIADSLQAGMGSMEQSIAVARSSLMLANVGDMTQNEASSAVNTMVKGFKIDPLKEVTKEMNGTVVKTNELTEAMDMLNHAGNNYAIGTDGVAEALKRGGSVLSEYGVSLGDTVALITSANEAVQNPEKVGNGMKSIAINLAGVKASAKDGTLELNKTAKALSEIAGVDIYSNKKTGEVKNMIQVIDEVQGKWKDLRDDERLALSEAIAGKEQAMIFQSLMGNFDTFKKMRDEFSKNDHLGSAEAENAQYVDSIAGKLNHLKEAWVSISQTMVSSDFTKELLDGAIKVSEAIDKIVKALDSVNALTPTLVAVGATFGNMMKTMIGNSKNGVSLLTPKAGGGIFSTLKNDITSASTAMQGFRNVGQTATTAVYSGVKDLGKGFLNAGKFIGSFVAQGLLIAGVTLAVQALAKVWDDMANGLENAEKEIKNTMSELNESISSNKADLKYLEETESRYNELIAKKKEYSTIPVENLSEDQIAEMQELKEITSELAEMFPQLVMGYDAEGSPIMLMTNDMEKLKERTREQIELEQKLLKAEREKLAINSRKQIQEGNFFGLGSGISEKMDSSKAVYSSLYDSILSGQKGFLNSMADGDMKYSQKQLETLNKQKQSLQNNYKERLGLYQEYSQKELEIQQSAFDQIQAIRGYDKLDETQASSVQGFIDNLNWGALDEGQYNAWISGSKELVKLAQSGSPKLEEWNKKLEKARDVYADNGDLGEYEKSLKGVAKTISEDLNIPYETVFAGLKNMVEPLAPAEQAMQNFLTTFGKTRHDLLNGDSIAQGLAEQFEAVNDVINNILGNESALKANGTLTYDMAIEIANKDALPDEVQKLVGDLAKGGVTKQENEIIVDLMYVLNEGDTEQAKAKIEEINKSLVAMGKEPINIDMLFDTKGLEQAKQLEDSLAKLRKDKTTANVEIVVDGQDKAQLYLDIINKLDTNTEFTNKFIVENQDALSQLKSYEDVVKWLQQNPDIVSKYKIQGIEALDKAEEKKKKVEKDGEGKTKVVVTTDGDKELIELNAVVEDTEGEKNVKITVDNGQVLDSIEDVETLIKYSAQMKDGQYKLDIQANTQDAVLQLEALEVALKKVSNVMTNTPTKTFKIETAQASKNVTGLRNNVKKLDDLMSTNTSLVFNSETAQASKNITGLINNVKRFMDLKPKTIVFKSETAQASKNITGLINKIKSVPTGTKTITYKVVTKYETQGSPTAQSSGNGGVRKARTITNNILPTPMARMAIPMSLMAMPTASEAPQNEPMPLMARASARATQGTPLAIAGKDIADGLEYNINLLKELEARISMVSNQLSKLDKVAKHAVGSEKIKYLQQQNTLYKEQMAILAEQEDALQRQSNYMKYSLENRGMKFNSDGNMTNYEEMIIKKEEEVKALEQKANKDNATDAEKKKYESAKSALDDLKKYAEEYYKVTFDELPKVKEEWLDLSNSIRENASAIKELERAQKLYTFNNSLRELSMLQDVVSDKMDIINEKMQSAGATDKLKYQQDLIKLLEEEQKIIEQQVKQYKESMKVYQSELKDYGFTFDSEGTIKNLQEILNKYQNSKDLEDVNKILEEYFDIQRDELPDALKEWEKNKNEILNNAEAVKKLKDELKDLTEDSRYKDNSRDIWEVEAKLSQNQINLDNSTGQNKIEYLEERIRLTQELKNETQDLLNFENQRRKELMSELGGYGFKFRDDGSIEAYGGKIEELKKTLSEEEFNQVFSKVEEYLDTTYEKIPDLEDKYLELGYSVRDYIKELEKLERERALDPHLNKVKQLETEYDKLADRLDIVGIKIKDAYGKDKLALIEEQIKLLEEQKDKQSALAKEYEAMRDVYKNDLSDYGIEFDESGDITNLDTILNKYKDHEDIETLKELVDEYLDIQRDKLPDAVKEWEKLNSAIKDAYKEQLNVTKEIEDEITAIYKKQVEERKKLIDEEFKKRLDAINKEKEAYNKAREEANYQDSYNDQMDKVQSLEKQLEIAKKDTSLTGQKKVQDLLDQLKEEQKKLQEMVQDKIDDQVNDMFDQESDRLQEEADKAKEDLDDQFSDEKIKDLVKEALNTGVFEDIDGTMRSLQDVMLEFVDKYGDGLGATGDLIKNELIANLEIAKNTMKDMVDISKELGLIKYSYDSDVLNNASRSIPQGRNAGSQSPVINFNESLINIEGNVDKNIVDELKSISQEIEDNVINSIVRELR